MGWACMHAGTSSSTSSLEIQVGVLMVNSGTAAGFVCRSELKVALLVFSAQEWASHASYCSSQTSGFSQCMISQSAWSLVHA